MNRRSTARQGCDAGPSFSSQSGGTGPRQAATFRERNPYEPWEAENSANGYAYWMDICRAKLKGVDDG